ncbi:VOC family protein [Cesiribacter andamanensis]|uniref:Lactoylglutathione lyase n=1 Tax=Cesiribacter andamanensis AMV16 TaxID=1279009 RepID=M7N3F4_9BACT|nr:VOC family protein [Cesiribacter andamanensis]EMR01807.1 Lactoylglutathione lyase [Cesiribacter andamanensis AMV16]
MDIEELNHVAIWVKDLEASRAFYQRQLGLEAIPRPAFDFPGAWFRLGAGQELHLIGGRKQELSLDRRHHFALKVRSAREAAHWLQQKGVTYRGPKPRPDGAIQLFIQDPDGYTIELFEDNA